MLLVLACASLHGDCRPPRRAPSLDPWGGDSRVHIKKTSGFFEVTEICGRSWFLTPDGHPLWSTGVNGVDPHGPWDPTAEEWPYGENVDALYASDEEWAAVTVARLQSWGFNTAGSWSDGALLGPYMAWTPNLGLSGASWESGEIVDWFDPRWEADVRERVAAGVHPEDPALMGYFLDNEIPWGPDWRGTDTLLQHYLALPVLAPGKGVAVDLLLSEGGGEEGIAELLGEDEVHRASLLLRTSGWEALDFDEEGVAEHLTTLFLEAAAERYFSTTTEILREEDPNHLILGNREVALLTRPEVWEIAARYVDVLSANNYVYLDGVDDGAVALSGALDPRDDFAAVHALTGKPLLITEFGFRAADAGLPNT